MKRDKAGFFRFYRYLDERALIEPLKDITARHGTNLYGVYFDVTTAQAIGGRLEIWYFLMTETNRSPGEVGTIFDRDRNSISYAIERLRAAAAARGSGLAPDTVAVLAKVVGEETARKPRSRVIKKKV